MKRILLCVLFLSLGFGSPNLFAAPPPTGQDVGATTRTEEAGKEKKAVEKKLTKKKEAVKVEGEEAIQRQKKAAELPEVGAKVLIKEITVEGVTLIKPRVIEQVVSKYKGKELTLQDFQAVADAISDEYRAKGYVTSFAYLPPQKVEQNTLRLAVVEGKVGDVKVTGNKWFRKNLLLRYVDLKRDDFFNYDLLRENVRRLNERQDVNGRVVLSRGEAAGATDVDVEVKDRFPWHASFGYNNYNSKFLEQNKYLMELKSSNLLGFGDVASGEVQLGEAGLYQLYSARYLVPLRLPKLYVGAYYVHVDQELGRSLKGLHITGKGDVLTTYFTYKLMDKENLLINVNPGFDYKNFENKQNGVGAGKDNPRILKLGFDFNFTDPFHGRNVITHEFDFGLSEIFGGMPRKAEGASRRGASGRFFRTVTNAARVQPMPLSTVLLLKGVMQLTASSLPSSEQYQIGGYYTVRGYPVAEHAGDSGYSTSAEWYIPPYFIPKNLTIPFTKQSFYDAINFLTFFDWGYVTNNSPKAGEHKDDALYSIGFGARVNVTDRVSFSFDLGIPLGRKTSDGSDVAAYVETKIFL